MRAVELFLSGRVSATVENEMKFIQNVRTLLGTYICMIYVYVCICVLAFSWREKGQQVCTFVNAEKSRSVLSISGDTILYGGEFFLLFMFLFRFFSLNSSSLLAHGCIYIDRRRRVNRQR